MDLKLEQKVAIVTGGSKGIGAGVVTSLLAEGACVVNVNREGPEGPELGRQHDPTGKRYRFIAGDLCDLATCKRAIDETVAQFGRLDILVNNAGVNDGVGLDAGPEAFLESLQKNLLHCYALVHYGLEELKKTRGNIVNIGSKVSITGQGNTSGYAAAKGGINGLTREWAVDLADDGIRVNAVLPAETWTPLYDKWLKTLPDPESTRAAIEASIPFEHRFTTVEELAAMVVFLASPQSSHTTGQIVFVDGGYTHFDRKCTAT